MKFSSESKLFIGVFVVTACIVAIAMFVMTKPAKPIEKDVLLLGATHTLGSKDASVWLVEFSDFQCPACALFYPEVKKLTETYKDSLFFVYRNYPLPSHPMAIPAAYAAEAAAMQGKYWEMHDALFTNQKDLSTTRIASEAARLGLREEAFNQDIKSDAVKTLVAKEIDLGNTIGVNATPTFYLNGKKLNLNTVADLAIEVEKAIQNIQ